MATPAQFQSYGTVYAGNQEPDGSTWFETWDEGKRFLLESKYQAQSEALWTMLVSANKGGLSVKVHYDPSEARYDSASKKFIFPICSVSLDEARVETARKCDATQPPARTAEAAIAMGLALSTSAAPRDAIGHLDKALAEANLNAGLKAIALGARARSYEAISEDEKPASEAADRAMVAALQDYRSLLPLTPNDVEIPLSIGWALQHLGSYDEARSTYQQILGKWPDEKFRVTLRLAALARQVGDVEDSLRLINQLSDDQGASGMRFHYHRGWSLTLLGRYDEAIADFTAGMKAQPDYPSAYSRRACAYASIGELRSALGDMEVSARLLARIPHAETQPSVVHDMARTEQVISLLRSAISSGRTSATPEVCGGYWGNYDNKRPLSPLLPSS